MYVYVYVYIYKYILYIFYIYIKVKTKPVSGERRDFGNWKDKKNISRQSPL